MRVEAGIASVLSMLVRVVSAATQHHVQVDGKGGDKGNDASHGQSAAHHSIFDYCHHAVNANLGFEQNSRAEPASQSLQVLCRVRCCVSRGKSARGLAGACQLRNKAPSL
jgi:hypothetical protein